MFHSWRKRTETDWLFFKGIKIDKKQKTKRNSRQTKAGPRHLALIARQKHRLAKDSAMRQMGLAAWAGNRVKGPI
jgi:hypothetical protein